MKGQESGEREGQLQLPQEKQSIKTKPSSRQMQALVKPRNLFQEMVQQARNNQSPIPVSVTTATAASQGSSAQARVNSSSQLRVPVSGGTSVWNMLKQKATDQNNNTLHPNSAVSSQQSEGSQMDLDQQKRLSKMVVSRLVSSSTKVFDKDKQREPANPYDDFTLKDLKVLEETINNNRNEIERELQEIQTKKQIKKQITLKPQVAKKWEKVKNQLIAFTVMRKIFKDIKQFGTSMQALSISNQVFDKCRDLLTKREIDSQPPKRMIYPDTKLQFTWMGIMYFLYIFTAIYSPYKIFFLGEVFNQTILTVLSKVIQGLFFLDILAKANTAMQDDEGNLIDDRKFIFRKYMRGTLFFDVLQVFPFEIFALFITSMNEFLIPPEEISEVVRIVRLPFLIHSIKFQTIVFEYFKLKTAAQRLARFIISVLLSLHVSGCIWVFIADQFQTNWIALMELDRTDLVRVYLFSVYWCLQTLVTVGFGDVHATNEEEVVFSIFWMVVGAGFYSFAIGELSKMFTDSDSRSQKLKNSIYIMDEFSEQTGLPRHIKDKIRRALSYSASKMILSSSEKEDFFDSIPMMLKTNLAEGMFKGTITTIPFLRGKDSLFLAHLLPMLHPLKLQRGDYVYEKDQFPNFLYFMIDGRVDFLAGPNEMTFKSFLPGSYFGEIDIFHQSLRKYSVRCQHASEFLTLDRDYFVEIMDKFPLVEQEMIGMAQKKEDIINQSLEKIKNLLDLKEVDPFWKFKDLPTFAEIMIQRRKSQSMVAPSDSDHDGNSESQNQNLLSAHSLIQVKSIQQTLNKQMTGNSVASISLQVPINNHCELVEIIHIPSSPPDTITQLKDIQNPILRTISYHKMQINDPLNIADRPSITLNKGSSNSTIPLLKSELVSHDTSMILNGINSNEQSMVQSNSQLFMNPPNHVMLNVFDENKQQKLVEFYMEDPKAIRQSKSPLRQAWFPPQQSSMTSDFIGEDKNTNQLVRIKQKYGVSSLDCIEERQSHIDADNASNQTSQRRISFINDKISISELTSIEKKPNSDQNQSTKVLSNSLGVIPFQTKISQLIPSLKQKPKSDTNDKGSLNSDTEVSNHSLRSIQSSKNIKQFGTTTDNKRNQVIKPIQMFEDDKRPSIHDLIMLDSSPEQSPIHLSSHLTTTRQSKNTSTFMEFQMQLNKKEDEKKEKETNSLNNFSQVHLRKGRKNLIKMIEQEDDSKTDHNTSKNFEIVSLKGIEAHNHQMNESSVTAGGYNSSNSISTVVAKGFIDINYKETENEDSNQESIEQRKNQKKISKELIELRQQAKTKTMVFEENITEKLMKMITSSEKMISKTPEKNQDIKYFRKKTKRRAQQIIKEHQPNINHQTSENKSQLTSDKSVSQITIEGADPDTLLKRLLTERHRIDKQIAIFKLNNAKSKQLQVLEGSFDKQKQNNSSLDFDFSPKMELVQQESSPKQDKSISIEEQIFSQINTKKEQQLKRQKYNELTTVYEQVEQLQLRLETMSQKYEDIVKLTTQFTQKLNQPLQLNKTSEVQYQSVDIQEKDTFPTTIIQSQTLSNQQLQHSIIEINTKRINSLPSISSSLHQTIPSAKEIQEIDSILDDLQDKENNLDREPLALQHNKTPPSIQTETTSLTQNQSKNAFLNQKSE